MIDIATLVVVPSDIHVGSQVGLFPPQWILADGATLHANSLQVILHRQWVECWTRVGELRKRARRMLIVNAGDTVEGDHHDTTELVTRRIDIQERIAVELLQEAYDLAGFRPKVDRSYFVSGTDAHSGNGSSSEERIARLLNTSKTNSTDMVQPGYLLDISGVLFDIAHHGPRASQRMWSRTSTLRNYFYSEYISRLERGERVPRVFLRGHGHQFAHASVTRQDDTVASDAFLLPAFCFKGDYAHKVAYDSLAHIGLWIGAIDLKGHFTWECPLLIERQTKIIEEG